MKCKFCEKEFIIKGARRVYCSSKCLYDGRIFFSAMTKNSPKRKRFNLLKKFGFRCQYCGATPQDGAKLEIDHIIPKSKGGKNNDENLTVACRDCNMGKGGELINA